MRTSLLPFLLSGLFLLACGTDETGLGNVAAGGSAGSTAGGAAGTAGAGAQGGSAGSSAGGTAGGGTAGTGGSEPAGAGGSDPAGAGGSDPAGAGGSDPAGAGGSDPAGAGGSDPAGAGGSDPAGAGGSDPAGAGGSDPAGAGGSDPAGAGGSDPAGAGGSDPAGAGGSDPAGAGGSDPAGAGGSDPAGAGGDAGSGGSGQAGAGAGGAPNCGTGFSGACGECLAQNCCAEAAACGDNCKACLVSINAGNDCQNDPEFLALRACSEASCEACQQGTTNPVCDLPDPIASGGSCVTLGSNGFNCNPITNQGCSSNQACRFSSQNGGTFQCSFLGNAQETCEGCNQTNPCEAGNICSNGVCQAYCCDDSDCNGGVCNKQTFPGGKGLVGICKTKVFAGTDPCAEDIHEPNNSADTAADLGQVDDCSFNSVLVAEGALSDASDRDWYRLDFEDTVQCSLEPTFQFTQGNGVRVCAYFKCKNGPTVAGQQVSCNGGDSASTTPFGPGCCSTDGNLTPNLNCQGDEESADVRVLVDVVDSNACIPYKLRYGF